MRIQLQIRIFWQCISYMLEKYWKQTDERIQNSCDTYKKVLFSLDTLNWLPHDLWHKLRTWLKCFWVQHLEFFVWLITWYPCKLNALLRIKPFMNTILYFKVLLNLVFTIRIKYSNNPCSRVLNQIMLINHISL